MGTSIRVKFSDVEYKVLDAVTIAAGCTKPEFIRRLFFEWRDQKGLLLAGRKNRG